MNVNGNNPENLKKILPENESGLLYGVSFFQKFPVTEEIKAKYPQIKRPSIQKAICVVSRRPIFGLVSDKFQSLFKDYFKKSSLDDLEVKKNNPADITQFLEQKRTVH